MRGDLPEDILEEILNLKKDRTVRTDLSELEMRGKEAFEAALGRLKENGCLLEDEQGLYLSEKGQKRAESVARKHAVLANFLTNVLGQKPDAASEEACRLEHKISTETINKLDSFLDRTVPKSGTEFADHNELTQKNPIMPLSDCLEGELLHVALIQEFAKHSRLLDMGIIPGELITLRRRLGNNAVVVKVKECEVALSPEVAANIMVERCASP